MSSLDKMVSSKKKRSPAKLVSPKKSKDVEYDTSKSLKIISHNTYTDEISAFIKHAFDSRIPSDATIVKSLSDLKKASVGVYKYARSLPISAYKAKTYEWTMRNPYYSKPVERKIINYPNAKDVTYDKLLDFIQKNSVLLRKYVTGKFMCTDFGELFHNRAEAAGIRCGYVMATSYDGVNGHVINVFYTPDRGAIFVDLTAPKIYDESGLIENILPYIIEMDILL
jgi:hypothetical protein